MLVGRACGVLPLAVCQLVAMSCSGGGGGANATGAAAAGAATTTSTSSSTNTSAGGGTTHAGSTTASSGGTGGVAPDASPPSDAGPGDDGASDACVPVGTDAGGCYATACAGTVRTLQANRDRLIADLAKRKCTDSCTLWAALSLAERSIFLMDTAYLGAPASRLYPPGANDVETALDHATAL
jgi:hypothetical protein